MISNDSSITPGTASGVMTPALNADGTISAIIRAIQPRPPAGALLRLWLPVAYDTGAGFGRFFLVRCAEDTAEARATDWSIYARRALYCAGMPVAMPDQAGSVWELIVPDDSDPGHRWLLRRLLDSSINLFGPLGQQFELAAHTRALVVLTDIKSLPMTLPAVHTMLDRGGRVTILIRGQHDAAAHLLPLIPIPVEVRMIPEEGWLSHLAEAVRWADQLCAALPNQDYAPLANQIRTVRFQLDNAFAHVLISSDLLCGVGACLACVTPTRDGNLTRACMHGPIFPLSAIA